MSFLSISLVVALCAVVVAVLSRRESAKLIGAAMRNLLKDPRELTLFAIVEIIAIAAVALLLAAFGPGVAGIVLIVGAALLAFWVLRKPPAARR
jgi:hypothetical protein